MTIYDLPSNGTPHIVGMRKRPPHGQPGYRNEAADLADVTESLRWIRAHGTPQQVKEAEEWYAVNKRKIPQLMTHTSGAMQQQIIRSVGGVDGIPAKYDPGITTLKDYDTHPARK